MNIENLTPKQLRQAADLQEKIEKLQHELAGIVGGKTHTPIQSPKPKRRMSAKARAKIAAGQKARWAKFHAKSGSAKAGKPVKKGKMSAEGRARIVAAQKARWAKVKVEAGKK